MTATREETVQNPDKTEGVKVLYCSKCGVLCPTYNLFTFGAVVGQHGGRTTHKLSIRTVAPDSKMNIGLEFAFALAMWNNFKGELD